MFLVLLFLCWVFTFCGLNILLQFDFATDTCQNRVVDFYPVSTGKRLENHTIHQDQTKSEDSCMILCFMEKECRSFNFNLTTDEDGMHLCEVNNSTAKLNPEDLKDLQEYNYRETKVRRNKVPKITG